MDRQKLNSFLISMSAFLVEAMQKIDENSQGILFVIDQQEKLCGSVSDGDIRRWILKTGKLDVTVNSLMNACPKFLYEKDVSMAHKLMEKWHVTAVPVTDLGHKVINILLLDDPKETTSCKNDALKGVPVIVMAGGKGTRLYPYTKILPKPLIPIGDIPIVERIIDRYRTYGVRDFYMTVNYRKNMIRAYFAETSHDYLLNYIEEEQPLGTAGSIRLIERPFKKPFFVTNCDVLIQADYDDLYRYHQESGNMLTIVTAMKNDVIPYGVVHSGENGELENIEEKPSRTYFINTGMYVINPEMIDLIPKNTFFHMTHLTEKALQSGYQVGVYPVSEDSFLDMGEFEEMKRMEAKLNLKEEYKV